MISDIKLNLPDLNDNNEWIDSREVIVENPETFVAAHVSFCQLGLYGKEIGKGDLIEQDVRYIQRISKKPLNKQ